MCENKFEIEHSFVRGKILFVLRQSGAQWNYFSNKHNINMHLLIKYLTTV